MRWSKAFIPTLREDPAAAEVPSHRLLLRAGYIRQLGAGLYSLLPLGQRVRRKIIAIIREEMNAIGGQEFLLPALHPDEIWKESGRWATMGETMFRLRDRKGCEMALGVTHEEVFTSIARGAISSYRQLPQIWYQFQTKFRDEPRPKSGLLRVREFTMKDSYSFDLDNAGLDHAFDLHHDAYCRTFERLGIDYLTVEASSGAMGGSKSIEFMVRTDAGEDSIVFCSQCKYSANLEKARSRVLPAWTAGGSAAAGGSGTSREVAGSSDVSEVDAGKLSISREVARSSNVSEVDAGKLSISREVARS
ncbi:MAG TPA: proline--tRNA ligase, partial [Candidatus Obscuribacterales bacterium]